MNDMSDAAAMVGVHRQIGPLFGEFGFRPSEDAYNASRATTTDCNTMDAHRIAPTAGLDRTSDEYQHFVSETGFGKLEVIRTTTSMAILTTIII